MPSPRKLKFSGTRASSFRDTTPNSSTPHNANLIYYRQKSLPIALRNYGRTRRSLGKIPSVRSSEAMFGCCIALPILSYWALCKSATAYSSLHRFYYSVVVTIITRLIGGIKGRLLLFPQQRRKCLFECGILFRCALGGPFEPSACHADFFCGVALH